MASNTIDQAISVYVKASTTVYDEIGTRFYYVEAERDASYPYSVYFVVSDPHEPFAFNAYNSGQARIQINTYDADRYNALEISTERLPLFAKKLQNFQPEFIRGYPTAIYLMARFAEKEIWCSDK